MSYLLSIDPGVRTCGCAMWLNGKLTAAKLVLGVLKGAEASPADLVEHMAISVKRWVGGSIGLVPYDLNTVIEMMRTYDGKAKGNADANDLIMVSLVSGGILMHMCRPGTLVLPENWKGGVPKKNRHGDNVIKERCLDKLSKEEIATIDLPAKSLEHNVWDAIGIGLRHLRNTGVRR